MSTRSSSPSAPGPERISVRVAIENRTLAARVRSELASSALLVEGDDHAALLLTDRLGPPATSPQNVSLSRRERDVAELLLVGASNKVVARRLNISVHTAKFHLAQILDKLGAQNRAEAVAIILRDGLIAL